MDMWVFGYGSLLWYQDFPHEMSMSGVVKGYARRFWQHSPDHRGTPQKPGRTVTLVVEEKSSCWGTAFKVPAEHVAATRAYLDHREKAGYTCVTVTFHPDDIEIAAFPVEVYMNVADNEHHAGPSEIDDIAHTILHSHGPSGPNLEYLMKLADVLHSKGSHAPDDHVLALETRVLALSAETGVGTDLLAKLGRSPPVPMT